MLTPVNIWTNYKAKTMCFEAPVQQWNIKDKVPCREDLENKRKSSIVYAFLSQHPFFDVFIQKAFPRFERWRGLSDAISLYWLRVNECSRWVVLCFSFFKTSISNSYFLQPQKMTSFRNRFFWVTIKLRWGHLYSV